MSIMQSLIVAPRVEVPEKVIAERTLRAALERLYDTFTIYTADSVAAGRSDVRGYCQGLRNSGAVVSLPPLEGRARVYPSFQFTADLGVRPVVASVNRLLDAGNEPIAAASWWAAPNVQLGGMAPFEVVSDAKADLMAAASLVLNIDN